MAMIFTAVFVIVVLGMALTFGPRRSFFWVIVGAIAMVAMGIALSQGYTWAQKGTAPALLLSINPMISGLMFLSGVAVAFSYAVMGILLNAISQHLSLSNQVLHIITVGLAIVIAFSFVVTTS